MPFVCCHADWLPLPGNDFRILILLAMCADSKGTYQGTLKETCAFLGLSQNNSRTNKKLQDSIDSLAAAGFLTQNKNGRTYVITLPEFDPSAEDVIPFPREWIMIAMKNKSKNPHYSVSWHNVLKVWIYLTLHKWDTELFTNWIIAYDLNLSESTVKNAKHVLQREYKSIRSRRVTTKEANGNYRCWGSDITVWAFWGNNSLIKNM